MDTLSVGKSKSGSSLFSRELRIVWLHAPMVAWFGSFGGTCLRVTVAEASVVRGSRLRVRSADNIALRRPSARRVRWLVLGLAPALGSCAQLSAWFDQPKAAPQETVEYPTPRAREPVHRPRPAAAHRIEPAAKPAEPPPVTQVASIDPHSLVGLTAPAVTKLLGAPARTATEQMSQIWTYGGEGCVLKVYFYPDLKTAAFHVLKYSVDGADGKPLADAAPCLRQIQSARSDDRG